jgi:hypothetical protein
MTGQLCHINSLNLFKIILMKIKLKKNLIERKCLEYLGIELQFIVFKKVYSNLATIFNDFNYFIRY